MRLPLCIVLVFIFTGVAAQDVNGIWRGKLTQEPGGCYPEYFIELQINQTEHGIAGFTYDYYDLSKYIKLDFTAAANALTSKLMIVENNVIEYKVPKDCIPCIKTYDLTLSSKDSEDLLTGTWKGQEMGGSHSCPAGNISLKRVKQSAFAQAVIKEESAPPLNRRHPLEKERKIVVVETLVVDTSKITVELFDNGQIDGDTVSIYLNQVLLLKKKRLSQFPLIMQIPVQTGKDYEMVMYADNLGSIPPNTALMVVKAGKAQYELYLSSSEQKSAAVKFRYVKKD